MDDGMEEILRRLEALERRVEELSQKQPSGERDEHDCPFRSEERRIVDLVVRLTAERVEEALARMQSERSDGWSGGPPHPGPYGEPPHGGPPHGHGPPPGWHGGPPRRGR